MKKLKILYLSFLIIITCTGCQVEYNLNIANDNIEETINVKDNITESRTKKDILNQYNLWYPTFVNYIKDGQTIEIQNYSQKVDGIEYHDKSIKEYDNRYEYNYKYTYNINDYYDAYSLASTYFETNIQNRSNSLVIRTSKDNYLCEHNQFESVIVNITIDPKEYKLKYTNTEDIKNNTYTWNLNRKNCENSEIVLTLDKIINQNIPDNNIPNDTPSSDITKKDNFNNYALYIMLGIICIILLIGYNWFNNLKQKNNNID